MNGLVRLPLSREFLNTRHIATANYWEMADGRPTLDILLAVPSYERNPDNIGSTDLHRLRVIGPDATALHDYLLSECRDLAEWRDE